jgi:pentatricopeptide repeat protein
MMASNLTMDMRTYNAYLHVCVRHRTPAATHDALRAFERIKAVGLTPDLLTYSNLLKACGQVGDVATCETLLQEMIASKLPLTQEALSNVFSVVPPEVSFKVLDALKNAGIKPDVVAYNMLLKRADPEHAAQVLQMMEEGKVEKDAVTYNTLIGVYGRSRSLQKCKELLKEMTDKGITADVWAYNAMIPALDVEQPADAIEWLREMISRDCQPDEVTYNSLFTHLLRKSKKSFVPLWEDMMKHEIKPSVYTYNLYVKARGQAGEVDACEPLLREMRTKDLQPDVVTYTTCFDFISDSVTLHRLFDEMLAQGVAPGIPSYVSLLRQCARNGDQEWAATLLQDAKKRGLISESVVRELTKTAHGPDGAMLVPEKLHEMYM